MVRRVQTLLHSQLACNEMQASARTCSRRHDQKCMLKSSQYTLIIPHRVIQLSHSGSPRQGCASHKSTNSEASEEPSDTVIHFYFFFIHRRAPLSAHQRQCSSNGANVPRTFWAKRGEPKCIASSQFDEYSQLGSRRKVRPIKNQLGSRTNIRPIKNGL